MTVQKRTFLVSVSLLIAAYLFFSLGGAKEAIAKLPNDIKGYPLEALATGTATDSSKLAQGKALMLIFATPT
jgi:hypothetical protein